MESVSKSTLYDIIAGLVIGAFFALSLDMGPWCIVPVIFAGFTKEFIRVFRGGEFNFKSFTCIFGGGLLITIFSLL